MATGTPWRGQPIPVGLTPEQHLAAAQTALAEFMRECAEEGWTLTSRPRLAIRPLELGEVELAGGRSIRVAAMNMWTVEADAER
ncbi:MAG: hypothetical protein K2X91_13115 [Thermoleophilia bacterium]|nr:hypothetical protein [Thermoleophilia bacterium]